MTTDICWVFKGCVFHRTIIGNVSYLTQLNPTVTVFKILVKIMLNIKVFIYNIYIL